MAVRSRSSRHRAEATRAAIADAYARFHDVHDVAVPDYYPALAEVDPDLFGIAVTATSGEVFTAGDVDAPFTIMSVAKPFVLALVLDELSSDAIRALVGVNATGFAFNSGIPVELHPSDLSNPLVNAGAIATTSLVPGANLEEKWNSIENALSRFAGRNLHLHAEVLASASASNHRNRSLANMLISVRRLAGDPVEAVELYTRQSSLTVTARDLATMGATLADGGVNPLTS